ncbi:MAG TPA: DNA mismatch endonuclease Vsr [Parvularculaceae bacterium]|nr:DNA mismatch endonuclease Vsr [Parvularculaceae bacterium]
MADVFSKAKRSEVMRAVKGANTKPEVALRKALFARGFRYRLHAKELPGKPDLVFPKYRAVIFVHGCFWHGHNCARGARTPATNRRYWTGKIERNRTRDKEHGRALAALGWRTHIVWECELRDISLAADVAARWLKKRRKA